MTQIPLIALLHQQQLHHHHIHQSAVVELPPARLPQMVQESSKNSIHSTVTDVCCVDIPTYCNNNNNTTTDITAAAAPPPPAFSFCLASLLFLPSPTDEGVVFPGCPSVTFVRPFVRTDIVTMISHRINSLSNRDKSNREYSLSPTDDLIRYWRLKVRVVEKAKASTLTPGC